jgi:hypothetical protein
MRLRDRAVVIRTRFVMRYHAGVLLARARALLAGRRDQTAKAVAVAVVYVYPIVGDDSHDDCARRFASTYRRFPGLADHTLHVMFNGGDPTRDNLAALKPVSYVAHQHDDSGWDVGAFQRAARTIDCDLMVFLGGSTYFKRDGWLRRMVDVYAQYGPGLYGASASYEISPHIRTTGFWCDPAIVRAYPKQVVTYEDRYAFEHSQASLSRACSAARVDRWLVTWDQVYGEHEWRLADNIFRRGDQSNSLVFDAHFDTYATLSAAERKRLADFADAR